MLRIFIIVILLLQSIFTEEPNSIESLKQKASKGDLEASFRLGLIYYEKNDIQNAVSYFDRASYFGHKKAKYNLANIYAQKNSGFYDPKLSYTLFLDLAKQNDPKAQNQLGLMLLYGIGVEKDYKLAIGWFEQSYFEGDYLPAVCSLSYMYATGKGVFFNLGRASVLAQKGIKQNLKRCKKIYQEYNLHKFPVDKGFKFGYYKSLE